MIRRKLLETVRRRSMVIPGERICIALSGGPDSTALLQLLTSLKEELKIELSACHINHQLRGKESDEDASFVAELCANLSIPCHTTTVDVKKYRSLTSGSIQSAARELRYLIFKRIIRVGEADKVASAHTADDAAETVMINFLRGSGLQGLSGIPPVREKHFIRPLIDVKKVEILEYLNRERINFREDSSNDDLKYLRNGVRKKLIPTIEKEFNKGLRSTLRRSAQIFGDIQNYISKQASEALNEISIPIAGGRELKIDCKKFKSIDKAIQREIIKTAVYRIRKSSASLTFEHIESLRNLACGNSPGGEVRLPLLTASVSHGEFFLSRHGFSQSQKFSYRWNSESPIVIKELNCQVTTEKAKLPENFDGNGSFVYLDGDSVPDDAQFRSRNEGDRFRPLGGSGTQKLKQFFIDKKIPRWERDGVILLASGSTILWVAGYRLSEDVKVGKDTKNVLKLKLNYE